ncbi:helix-turn-helix domain-containing protein [Paraburkholderia bannensis]|uniref:helix-turn-helix domain-containing protein n=1 Tax=Paraburkholderia bannensis TaxID=765414 RepID=UPI002AB7D082|nr:helix-turn-helix domain-containing protein [Paraburkholderia bannensis]
MAPTFTEQCNDKGTSATNRHVAIAVSPLPPPWDAHVQIGKRRDAIGPEHTYCPRREPQLDASGDLTNPLSSALFSMVLRCALSTQHLGNANACQEGYIEPAFDHIFSDPARDWAARELANICGIDERSFLDVFVSVTEEPVSDFLERVRVALAMKILLHSDDLIGVASIVGYDNIEDFEEIFKEKSGVDTSGWRAWVQNRLANSAQEYVLSAG